MLESNTVLIANAKAMNNADKKQKLENLVILLGGALQAEQKVGLKMNVLKSKLNDILEMLPSLTSPTVAALSNRNWLDVDTILDEKTVRDIIPKLKRAGAEGIVEYPLNKVIY